MLESWKWCTTLWFRSKIKFWQDCGNLKKIKMTLVRCVNIKTENLIKDLTIKICHSFNTLSGPGPGVVSRAFQKHFCLVKPPNIEYMHILKPLLSSLNNLSLWFTMVRFSCKSRKFYLLTCADSSCCHLRSWRPKLSKTSQEKAETCSGRRGIIWSFGKNIYAQGTNSPGWFIRCEYNQPFTLASFTTP